MFDYKIQLKGQPLPKKDEEVLVSFLKMLDFSAEYLNSVYQPEEIRFCPEQKEILIGHSRIHKDEIYEIANSYGFKLKNQ